ncbi:unnamed protein product, partial [Ectocarpus sp. 12 AP-2014]
PRELRARERERCLRRLASRRRSSRRWQLPFSVYFSSRRRLYARKLWQMAGITPRGRAHRETAAAAAAAPPPRGAVAEKAGGREAAEGMV